jgi:hypothetical protein
MQMLYKLYTKDANRATIEAVLCKHVQSFTIYPAVGYYDGIKEKAVVIDCFGTTRAIVETVCQEIIKTCNQQSVGVVEIPCNAELVFAPMPIPTITGEEDLSTSIDGL